ncbi:hypothetical protein AB6A40_000343 [Gnathostoma spinigerum]|uniref:Uncharacterized protein n=1 Tax=Gnathostoma spinigerum TaxID=75299 RepID=A0ABD6E1X1_9BILA
MAGRSAAPQCRGIALRKLLTYSTAGFVDANLSVSYPRYQPLNSIEWDRAPHVRLFNAEFGRCARQPYLVTSSPLCWMARPYGCFPFPHPPIHSYFPSSFHYFPLTGRPIHIIVDPTISSYLILIIITFLNLICNSFLVKFEVNSSAYVFQSS